jgi:LPXTG-motif cell wall-anchored protein
VEDPSDAFWREGLNITVEVNPTANASVTYPPATTACASPEPIPLPPPIVPPNVNPPPPGGGTSSLTPGLPVTGNETIVLALAGLLLLGAGGGLVLLTRRPPR